MHLRYEEITPGPNRKFGRVHLSPRELSLEDKYLKNKKRNPKQKQRIARRVFLARSRIKRPGTLKP